MLSCLLQAQQPPPWLPIRVWSQTYPVAVTALPRSLLLVVQANVLVPGMGLSEEFAKMEQIQARLLPVSSASCTTTS